MSLHRTNPRRVITYDRFSFASGSVNLIHPNDMPHSIVINVRRDNGAVDLEDYLAFNVAEGVLDPDDFIVLDEMTSKEVGEFVNDLLSSAECDCPAHSGSAGADDIIAPLTPEQEAEVQKFSDFLNGLASATEPDQDEDDEDGDGGLTSV